MATAMDWGGSVGSVADPAPGEGGGWHMAVELMAENDRLRAMIAKLEHSLEVAANATKPCKRCTDIARRGHQTRQRRKSSSL